MLETMTLYKTGQARAHQLAVGVVCSYRFARFAPFTGMTMTDLDDVERQWWVAS